MPTATVYTVEQMQAFINDEIVSGEVDASGNLILAQRDGDKINAGVVRGTNGGIGPQGPAGPTGTAGVAPPTGGMMEFAGTTAPTGYVLCNGQAISRSTYSTLYNVIGTTYGNGDGSTTFNVPDMRDRAVFGYNPTGSFFTALGRTGGGTSHSHVLSDNAAAAISFAVSVPGIVGRRIAWAAGMAINYTFGTTASSTASSSASTAVPLMGNTDATTMLPPYITLNYIIKT